VTLRERLFAGGILLGVLLLLGVVGWVFLYGRLDPSPPSLRDNPQPSFPGEVLYVDNDGCIISARASGEEYREITCQREIDGVSWLSDGRIVYSTYGFGPARYSWFVLDPATGQSERLDSTLSYWEIFNPQPHQSPKGETYSFDGSGDVILVDRDGNLRTVFEYNGPDGYSPEFRTWSPSGDHLLVYYGKDEELWVIAADGSAAGTLASGVRWNQSSWRIDGVGLLPEIVRPIDGLR
jgi:hypothetical protein